MGYLIGNGDFYEKQFWVLRIWVYTYGACEFQYLSSNFSKDVEIIDDITIGYKLVGESGFWSIIHPI